MVLLGISQNICGKPNTLILEKGDTIFLYTDGVSEAFDTKDQQYSIKKISEMLEKQSNHHPMEIIHNIVDDVKTFSHGAEQSDDISLLAIQYSSRQILETSG